MKTDQDLIFEAYAQFNNTHDENQESSVGAVNLLEQMKEEFPELEIKVNNILEKVFDAVDVLKQERYVNDPELKKAHASLIEGNF